MSVFQTTPGIYRRSVNFLRDRLIRNGVSRGLNRAYARIGFADRTLLTQQLHNPALNIENHELLIDNLVAQGVLKDRFRPEVMDLQDIQPFMLRATPRGRMEIEAFSDLNLEPLYAQNLAFVSTIAKGVNHAYYSIVHYQDNETLAGLFAAGANAAKGIGIALGIAGAAWFIGGLPALTPGLAMGGLTALCVLAAKYNDKLPLHGTYGRIGSVLRFISRRAAPALYVADGFYLGHLVYEANLNIQNIFDAIGLAGTVTFFTGLALTVNHFLKSHLKALNKAYGGMLDPGMQKYMGRLMSSAIYSTVAEVHYIGTRLMLFGGASAYLLMNTVATLGPWGAIPLAIPLLGFGATAYLRGGNIKVPFTDRRIKYGRQDVTYDSKEQADRLDHLKVWAPLWGLGAGMAAAIVNGIADMSAVPLIAYTTLYGSFATLFLNELHGSFHSINTSAGFMNSLLASAKDLVGEREKRELTDHKRMLIINPHTGLHEHSYGYLFSLLINRKPGAAFICMYDLVCAQQDNRDNHRMERKFIAECGKLQRGVFDRLMNGISARVPLEQRYRRFIANLRELAEYYDNGLQQEIREMVEQNGKWFFPLMELAEARRAIFEQMTIRGQEFNRLADQMEAQVALQQRSPEGYISENDFYEQYSHLLRCFDPEFVTTTIVARKSGRADEKMIRKVENVATGLILRGMTVYKGYFVERYSKANGEATSDAYHNEDWISGTWTSLPNPEFRYDAEPGTFGSVKHIWVLRDHVLTGLQEQNLDPLSSSTLIAHVENIPSANEGFRQGSRELTVTVNGENKTLAAGEYFFHQNADTVPTVKRVVPRHGVRWQEMDGYQLAVDNQRLATIDGSNPARPQLTTTDYSEEHIDKQPLVLRPPAFDYSLMMDKNDVQVNPDLLPTILERAKLDRFLHLMLRQPVGHSYTVDNPHPDKTIDLSQGGIVDIDTTIEISHTTADGREFIIPFKADRFGIHMGIQDNIHPWREGLNNARVIMKDGQPVYFGLVYRGMAKNQLALFQHGVITREALAAFGANADAVWTALVQRGYIKQQPGVGLVQAEAAPLPARLQMRLTRQQTSTLKDILLGTEPVTRDSLKMFGEHSEAVWQILLQEGYLRTNNDTVIVEPKAGQMPAQLDLSLSQEQTTVLRTILRQRDVINKSNLSLFGAKTGLVWQALIARGQIVETEPVGLVQAAFHERSRSFDLGLERGFNKPVAAILDRATRQEIIWKDLHDAGYLGETTFSGGVKDDLGIIQPAFYENAFALRGNYPQALLAQIKQIVADNDREMSVPPRYFPESLLSLNLPADTPPEGLILQVNNFMRRPHREGEQAWVKIYYTDGTIAFARTVDGDRPMLMNKDYREYLRRHENEPGQD